MRRPLKELASDVIDRQPAEQARKAHDAEMAWCAGFREALVLGRLHVCANCERFTSGAQPAQLGQCELHGDAWPFVPFQCPDFALSATPAVPAYSPATPFLLDAPEEQRR